MLNINENQVKDSGYAAAIIFLICSLFLVNHLFYFNQRTFEKNVRFQLQLFSQERFI